MELNGVDLLRVAWMRKGRGLHSEHPPGFPRLNCLRQPQGEGGRVSGTWSERRALQDTTLTSHDDLWLQQLLLQPGWLNPPQANLGIFSSCMEGRKEELQSLAMGWGG